MDDSLSLTVVNVTDKMGTTISSSNTVKNIEYTEINDSNESNVIIESTSKVCNASIESNKTMESKKVKSKNVFSKDVESMDEQDNASQCILTDSVTHQCGEGPQSVSLVSDSLSGP